MMIVYNWLTEETAPIVMDFIDNFLNGTPSKGVEPWKNFRVVNQMKLISLKKDDAVYTIVFDEDGVKHSSDLDFNLSDSVISFILQEIRNQKLEDLGV